MQRNKMQKITELSPEITAKLNDMINIEVKDQENYLSNGIK